MEMESAPLAGSGDGGNRLDHARFPADRRRLLLIGGVLACIALAFAMYFAALQTPGFYADESSVALNALTIAEAGIDEHGARWPLFFRAFGEWKNAPFIYLLAAVFKISGPSIEVARLVSTSCVVAAALVVGMLSRRVDAGTSGVPAVLLALSTPWLFDIGRLVFEVALFPLACALFLLAALLASRAVGIVWPVAALFGASTALVTYSYTAGRFLGPVGVLLAVLLLSRKERQWNGTLLVGSALAALSLLPLVLFHRANPGALTARFRAVGAATDLSMEGVVALVGRVLSELNPFFWMTSGQSFPRHHIPGMASVPFAVVLFALAGIVVALSRGRRERWYLFLLGWIAVSVLPAAAAEGAHHALRLSGYMTGLLVLSACGLAYMRRVLPPLTIPLLVLSALVQGVIYLGAWWTIAPRYAPHFDAQFPYMMQKLVESDVTEVWLPDFGHDNIHIVHARWYESLEGSSFPLTLRIAPVDRVPDGAMSLSRHGPGMQGTVLMDLPPFVLYRQETPRAQR